MSRIERSSTFTNCSELCKYIKNQRARAHYIILITQPHKIFTSTVPRITTIKIVAIYYCVLIRGVARIFFLGGGCVGIKLQYSTVLTSLLLHTKFTWTDFGRVYYPPDQHTPSLRLGVRTYAHWRNTHGTNAHRTIAHWSVVKCSLN